MEPSILRRNRMDTEAGKAGGRLTILSSSTREAEFGWLDSAGKKIAAEIRVPVARELTHCQNSRRAQQSGLSRPLGVAADNLDLLGLDGVLVVKFEVDILDQERPDFVAEAVGVQMTLEAQHDQPHRQGRNGSSCTLKFKRALTFSFMTSETILSKFLTILLAS